MNRSIKSSQMSQKQGGAAPPGRNVTLPSIPSNLDKDLSANFNSIGYYGDLLSRLDNQIGIVEDVYKSTFDTVQHQQAEKSYRAQDGHRIYQLGELTQVKEDLGDGKQSVIDMIL